MEDDDNNVIYWIPIECWLNIFQYLPDNDLFKLVVLNVYFSNLTESAMIYRDRFPSKWILNGAYDTVKLTRMSYVQLHRDWQKYSLENNLNDDQLVVLKDSVFHVKIYTEPTEWECEGHMRDVDEIYNNNDDYYYFEPNCPHCRPINLYSVVELPTCIPKMWFDSHYHKINEHSHYVGYTTFLDDHLWDRIHIIHFPVHFIENENLTDQERVNRNQNRLTQQLVLRQRRRNTHQVEQVEQVPRRLRRARARQLRIVEQSRRRLYRNNNGCKMHNKVVKKRCKFKNRYKQSFRRRY